MHFYLFCIHLSVIFSSVRCSIDCDEEAEIDESLAQLSQDDPKLIEEITNYFLAKPASRDLPYNIPDTSSIRQGQFKQARIVDLFYNESKRDGFFFEAGAYDGVIASNTLFFEMNRGWTGLLVEANPDNYNHLLNRGRKSWSLGNCISMSDRADIIFFDSAAIFGGIIREGLVRPGDNIPKTDREQQMRYAHSNRKTIKMQCFPLYSMLLAVGNPTVDYMSLDIEGAEYGALKSLPWDKVDIKVFSLEIQTKKLREEAEGSHENNFKEIDNLLTSQGYTLVRADWHTPDKESLEAYYVKNDLAEHVNKAYWKLPDLVE